MTKVIQSFWKILIGGSILTCVALIPSGCDKGPTDEKNPFEKTSFRTIDETAVLTILTKSEIEYRERGTSYVGSYEEDSGTIRAVFDILGTKQALYFTEIPDGLRDQKGNIFYRPVRYDEVMKAVTVQRRQQAINDQLLKIAGSGNVTTIESLLTEGASVSTVDRNGQSRMALP